MATNTNRAPATSADGTGTKAGKRGGAPTQLATPTDLPADAVQAVTDAVNPLIADAFALYTKTKNFHWHLAGSHFRDYHLLFDEQAAAILESIDPMAERVRKIGGTTLRGISHIGRLQTIPDDEEAYVPPGEMVRRLLDDNRQTAAAMRSAIRVAEEHEDVATSNLLADLLDKTERRVWFLFEITQGGEHTA